MSEQQNTKPAPIPQFLAETLVLANQLYLALHGITPYPEPRAK